MIQFDYVWFVLLGLSIGLVSSMASLLILNRYMLVAYSSRLFIAEFFAVLCTALMFLNVEGEVTFLIFGFFGVGAILGAALFTRILYEFWIVRQ